MENENKTLEGTGIFLYAFDRKNCKVIRKSLTLQESITTATGNDSVTSLLLARLFGKDGAKDATWVVTANDIKHVKRPEIKEPKFFLWCIEYVTATVICCPLSEAEVIRIQLHPDKMFLLFMQLAVTSVNADTFMLSETDTPIDFE